MFWLGVLTGWIFGFLAAAIFVGAVREWDDDTPELVDSDAVDPAPRSGARPRAPQPVRQVRST